MWPRHLVHLTSVTSVHKKIEYFPYCEVIDHVKFEYAYRIDNIIPW